MQGVALGDAPAQGIVIYWALSGDCRAVGNEKRREETRCRASLLDGRMFLVVEQLCRSQGCRECRAVEKATKMVERESSCKKDKVKYCRVEHEGGRKKVVELTTRIVKGESDCRMHHESSRIGQSICRIDYRKWHSGENNEQRKTSFL